MGLSATQARFLMVTARKSNVEYQGQQINQARTILANQSADLYSQLSNLQAPTAPSAYTYVIDPATKPYIDWDNNASWPLSGTDQKNFNIYYSAHEPEACSFVDYYEQTTQDGISGYRQKSYDKDGNVVYGEFTEELPEEGTYAYQAKDENGTSVVLMNVDSEDYTYDAKNNVFVPNKDSENNDIELPKNLQAYNAAQSQYQTYSVPNHNAFTVEDKNGEEVTGYVQSATVSYNTAQYEAALKEYEKEKQEYDEACAKINAETEKIQQADKTLELQLKQLDTEQNAIQTEYEALQKVITKNIENTYKTFGNA